MPNSAPDSHTREKSREWTAESEIAQISEALQQSVDAGNVKFRPVVGNKMAAYVPADASV